MTAIYVNGKPDNAEAAAMDALVWLRYFRNKRIEMSKSNRHKLDETIRILEEFEAENEFEFHDGEAEA